MSFESVMQPEAQLVLQQEVVSVWRRGELSVLVMGMQSTLARVWR